MFGIRSFSCVLCACCIVPAATASAVVVAFPAAGSVVVTEVPDDERVYLKADSMPTFCGAAATAFRRWVPEHLEFADSLLRDGVRLQAVVSFVVGRAGEVGDVSVLTISDPRFTDAFVRAVSSSPAWTPGMSEGRPVRVKMVLPFDFRMQKAPETPDGSENPEIPQTPDSGTLPDVASAADSGTLPDEDVSSIPLRMPSFEGGDLAGFGKWVSARMQYPADLAGKKFREPVLVTFYVEKDGSLSQAEVEKSPHELFSREVLRVLETSPRWTPAVQNGALKRIRLVVSVELPAAPKGGKKQKGR